MKNKFLLVAALAAASVVTGAATSCAPTESNTYRLVIAGMTDTAERRNSIDFTNPYYQSELVLVVRKSDDLSSDHIYTREELAVILKDKILVSQTGTETYRMLDIFVEEFGAIKANGVNSFTTASIQVTSDKAFGFTAEKPVALSYVNRNPDDLMVLYIAEDILSADDYASLSVSIGIKKGCDDFVTKLNTALDQISNDERESIMTTMVDFNLSNNEANDNIRTPITGTKGKIIIGLECDYPSFNWTETEQNNYTYPIRGKSKEFAEGYDVEIAIRIAQYLDMTLEIQKMEWDSLLVWANK